MRLAVRTPNWLGDLVMALPSLSSLSSAFPGLCFWSHSRVAGLLPVFFPGVDVHTSTLLRGRDVDRLLLMTGSFRSALMGLLSGIPERIGHSTDMRGFILTEGLRPPLSRDRHHSLDYSELAVLAGACAAAEVPEPSVTPTGDPHLAFFAGSRYGPAKRWPGFQPLARRLSETTGLVSVFYGSKDEEELLRETASAVPGSTVRTGLPLPELVSCLLASVLAVGNDSGGVHLSAALGVPTLTIFCSTSPLWTAPAGRLTSVLHSARDCSPCFRPSCPFGRADCLEDVECGEAIEEALSLLERAERLDHA